VNALSSSQEEEIQNLVTHHWPAARLKWSQFLLLSDPANGSNSPSVAQIHLGSRQVLLNFSLIAEKDLGDCVEALLAHEVGHHVKYPGTLAVEARLRLLEKSLIPIEGYSLTNLFTDLMINEYLGRTMQSQLTKLYQTLGPRKDWERDPAFVFYLAIYEELWALTPGTLMQECEASFAVSYPGFRGDARLLAGKLFHMEPNIYTQFLYFVSVLTGYIKPPKLEKPESQNPSQCHADAPSPDDWADALRPNSREKAAIQRGLAEGWLSKEDAEKLSGKNVLERRIASLPGVQTGNAEQVPEIMAAFYRREAERYLFNPPSQQVLGEAVVPTNLLEWEYSDPVKEIDWLQTLIQGGSELGSIQPLKRSHIGEVEGYDMPLWRPFMEIYLDVSGSMPDPRFGLNAMTLASLILVSAAIRQGGWARALLYSTDLVSYWNWCRSEIELSRFLMHYFGAGTQFPFARLAASLQECGAKRPIRVLITDSDFNMNFSKEKNARQILGEAVRCSAPLILLLHNVATEAANEYRKLGAMVIQIADLGDFPKMAGQLAAALFIETKSTPIMDMNP